jgi:hypothetical protein
MQTNSGGNAVYAKDCKIYMEGSQTNEDMLNGLEVTSILDKITNYESDWIQHINRKPKSRLPNLLTKYDPKGIRN